jgi:2-polyprenyl-3-methyl-5-hydroxy-6-metoxy-1,4-benzoquinol methylase
MDILGRFSRTLRYRVGQHVVAPGLESGTDDGVRAYYNSRLSECSFLEDPAHYERPRIDWMLERVAGGTVLEIGCADGTVTAMLARRVGRAVGLDVCAQAISRLRSRGLPNVECRVGLIEDFTPTEAFDWIVVSEVLEHLRHPQEAIGCWLGWLRPGGTLLLSSPDGRWEGDAIEHLHVFSLESWCSMLVHAGARAFRVFRIRDRGGRDRWLGAEIYADDGRQTGCPPSCRSESHAL